MSKSPPAAPLTDLFRARGIPLVEVTPGQQVPTRFGDPLAEQRATRLAAGLYDFSFMAAFDVRGGDAMAYLNRVQTRDAATLRPGQLRYTLLLADDGSVYNDASIWRLGADRFRIVTGRPGDAALLRLRAHGHDVRTDDLTGTQSVLSLQGPASAAILHRLGVRVLPPYFGFAGAVLAGIDCTIARIGYSGELGYEMFAPARHGPALWDALARDGRRLGAIECGFEAADALRIECGFVLFSRELALPVWPEEIGLGRLLDKRPLRIDRGRKCAAGKHLVGLIPLSGSEVGGGAPRYTAPDRGLALPTSARYSALFSGWLALGYVHPDDRYPGTGVRLADGGRARVARLPFYDPVKRRPRAAPE
jgi:aminomethyltransferase